MILLRNEPLRGVIVPTGVSSTDRKAQRVSPLTSYRNFTVAAAEFTTAHPVVLSLNNGRKVCSCESDKHAAKEHAKKTAADGAQTTASMFRG